MGALNNIYHCIQILWINLCIINLFRCGWHARPKIMIWDLEETLAHVKLLQTFNNNNNNKNFFQMFSVQLNKEQNIYSKLFFIIIYPFPALLICITGINIVHSNNLQTSETCFIRIAFQTLFANSKFCVIVYVPSGLFSSMAKNDFEREKNSAKGRLVVLFRLWNVFFPAFHSFHSKAWNCCNL